ncbi:helix-turn-helix domain-containing protein [Bifidobacterium pseudolongum]|uniref:helix-turn-helix transcriptional regulator n=1 Tax=Bifidobacterium pseudolongum TaxID=1694 RepID=UPI001F0F821F|nr:helix-turn-helix domain-containing protein [Bifidobacterium pseudolongum]MCH4859369.1 helix-turn-helix domain-containing protein [Bifidobacterium pseudolongum]MCH4861140.1 helix-turn-helix domain-containing protein [Bifidobacterium pseudolongum]
MTTQVKDVAASLLVVWNTLQAKLSTAVNPDDLLMTPEEVAAYTGLSVPALAMMRHRRQGPSFTRPTPRTMLYRKRDVDAWVNEGRVEIVRADDERLKDTEHVTVVPAQETKG